MFFQWYHLRAIFHTAFLNSSLNVHCIKHSYQLELTLKWHEYIFLLMDNIFLHVSWHLHFAVLKGYFVISILICLLWSEFTDPLLVYQPQKTFVQDKNFELKILKFDNFKYQKFILTPKNKTIIDYIYIYIIF